VSELTNAVRAQANLSQGVVRYRETGPKDGDPIVFVHGVLVNGSLWDGVVAGLSREFRCIVPDWPLGSHEVALAPNTDLTPAAVAALVVDFLDTLGLGSVTLVGNDSGGAISQLVAARHSSRVSRLVLTNCDAFDNFPPKMFAYLRWATFVPGAVSVLSQSMRFNATRRMPFAFGRLTKKPIDRALLDSFVSPSITDKGVRRDIKKFLRGVSPRYTIEAAESLRNFEKPVLLAWGTDDKFFPAEHALRLQALLPNARLEWVEDARAFVPLDQPDRLATLIAEFMREA
jgi:pimeloyl-ACP methyl ester carboxylesterase